MNQFISPELKDFDTKGYYFFGLWKQKLFSMCFWVSGWNKEIMDQLGLHADQAGVLILGPGNFFVKNSEIKNIKKQVFEKIESHDEEFFKHMDEVADTVYAQAIIYSKTLATKEPTSENFWEFVQVARRVNFLWFIGAEQLSVAAEEKLHEIVAAESFPAEKVSGIVPKFNTPLNQQHLEVVEFKKQINNKSFAEVKADSVLFAKLEDHVNRFAWIEVANFEGLPLTVERLYEQIIHAKEEARQENNSTTPISSELAFRARCLSYCGYIRQAGAEHFFMLSEKALPFLHKISDKLGISYTELLLLRDVEILESLKGNIDTVELKARAVRRDELNTAMFAGVGDEVFFCEEPADIKILKQEMIPQADQTKKEIEGQTGNKGTYTGPARIIMNTGDFSKMQLGDVLISTMTTPDFVVLMHKAGAIVTDIGGITCHAAIVAREMKKPCIIGTKIATKILKDGDLVEVDADKGIVRIII